MTGYSDVSGEFGYIEKHHILPKWLRFRRKDCKRVKITNVEHRTIHQITDGVKDKDTILGMTLTFLLGKKFNV